MQPESYALKSGVRIPKSVVDAASDALMRREVGGKAAKTTRGGTWQGLSTLSGGVHPRENRLRDFESYLTLAPRIPWVYPAGSTIAWAYATINYHITSGRKKDPVAEGDPQLERLLDLLDQPNPWMTGRRFREKLCWHYLLTGNAFMLLDDVDMNGIPNELYLLRPSKVRIQPDPKTYIKAFWYEVNGELTRYDPDRILWFRRENPSDEFWGLGVIEPGESVFQKQRAIARTENSFFDSGARVKGVLTYDGTLSEEQEMAVRESWRGMDEGQSGQFTTAILQAGLEYEPIQSDLLANGTGMETLAKMARDEILTLFGVPKQKIGIFEDANYRSIEADSFFQAETMSPIYQGTGDTWSELTRRYNPAWRFTHTEKVVVDYYDKAVTAHYMAQSASFKRDEIRDVSGQEKLDQSDPRGGEILGPQNMTVFEFGGPVNTVGTGAAGYGQNQEPDPDDDGLKDDDTNGTGDPRNGVLTVLPNTTLAAPTLAASGFGPGKKSCGCPDDFSEEAMRPGFLTAMDIGVCPRHLRLVDQALSEARRRRYSATQTVNGVPKERFSGIKALVAS